MKQFPRSISRPFALEELVIAYRHTKADLFAERSIPSRLALLDYEKNLIENLKELRKKLNALTQNDNASWWVEQTFLGEILSQPKSVDCSGPGSNSTKNEEPHFYVTDPKNRWDRLKQECSPTAKFRTMAVPSIDFQILGTLWIMKVGHLLDAELLPCCRGNRLKRITELSTEEGQQGACCPLNDESPGVFRPYYFAYREWRRDGLRAIEAEISNDHRVIAITMDLRQYFHRIDPEAIGNKGLWTETFGVHLSKSQEILNLVLVRALKAWAARAPEGTGLPVGLLASRVIANVLLQEFDKAVTDQLNPVFYARYVDDILMVIRPQGQLDTPKRIMKYIADVLSDTVFLDENELTLSLRLKFVGRSQLEFGANKQRIFDFRGKSGLDLLATINREIDELSSEFRLVPDFSEEEESVLRQALVADHDFEIGADSLRKADSLTIRRLGLAILLRNYEMLERCMASPQEWAQIRKPFYNLLEEHVLTPERYCTYFQYLPRVFGLIAANGDWEVGERLLKKIEWIHNELKELPNQKQKKP